MPAVKPIALHTRHSTKAEKIGRESGENALRPQRELPMEPAILKGHPVAKKTYAALLREFDSIEGELVTRLDFALLVDYCILVEQTNELDAMRQMAFVIWQNLAKEYTASLKMGATDVVISLSSKMTDAYESIIKLDGRVDRKRALLLQHRQSLYLTPRARAGAAPNQKAPEEPKDPLEQLLDEVNDYVNGGQGGA